MSETRNFNAPNLDLSRLATALVDWYRGQDFKVQQIDMQEGGILVQASQGGWRNVVGMASALNVVLRQDVTGLVVEIGAGKWLDKAAVGAVSMFVLWPLALAAAYGAWQQSQLPKRTFEFIQQYLAVSASPTPTASAPSVAAPATPVIVPPAPPTPPTSTPEVATASTTMTPGESPPAPAPSVTASLRFCPACGNGVSEADRFCSSCGHKLS
jgi:hypothetical protein